MLIRSLTAALVLACASPVLAQVGYPPAESPFKDLEYRQEFSLSSGYYVAAKDPAGVAPQSGPMIAARYDLRLANPLLLTVHAARVFTDRTVVSFPTESPRVVSNEPVPLWLFDTGFTFSLTGAKSYRGIVPVVIGTAGIALGGGSSADAGGFKFGTPLALSFGGGVRWVTGGKVQVRADVVSHLYQVHYPDSYFAPPDEGEPLRPVGASQSSWTRNVAFTIGASYVLLR